MKPDKNTVFVLGAGFTRAFLPEAPLVVDDYGSQYLMNKFRRFSRATQVLELEVRSQPDGLLDIERLMTRLEGLMPYDYDMEGLEELRLLLSELKGRFLVRLEKAKQGEFHSEELAEFASYCIEQQIACITFNYDDILDRALWEVNRVSTIMTHASYWHPDGGYGFFCRPSVSCINMVSVSMDQAAMLLLKLHGSINWRIRLGFPQPYGVDALVHHEPWSPSLMDYQDPVDPDVIERHLDPDPFIVPPVLMKSALVEQPILRLVWSQAFGALRRADRVVFVGYSLPVTDIAARFLFGEALQRLSPDRIEVVNLAPKAAQRMPIRAAYRAIFPDLDNEQFKFSGALKWAQSLKAAG